MTKRDPGANLSTGAAGEQATPAGLSAVEWVKLVAESDWTDIELSYLAVNTLYARGATAKAVRRDGAAAVRTLQAILRDARQVADTAPPLPADVVRLVIAARIVAFEDQGTDALRELDEASEAFASRVPWDDEPEETQATAGSGEAVAPQVEGKGPGSTS